MREQENIFRGKIEVLGFDTWYDGRGWVESYRCEKGKSHVWNCRQVTEWKLPPGKTIYEGIARPDFPTDHPLIITYTYFAGENVISVKLLHYEALPAMEWYPFRLFHMETAGRGCWWLYVSVRRTQRFLVSQL